jgi:hypothetical protein
MNKMQRERGSSFLGIGCLMWLVAGAAACGSSTPAKTDSGVDAGTGTGGKGGSGGGGGMDASADKADTGTGTGGKGGSGGGQGGAAGGFDAQPDMPLCEPSVATQPSNSTATNPGLIANFDDGTDTSFGILGIDPVIGQTYITSSLMADFTGSNWHITGTVSDDKTFFGFWWNCTGSPTGGCTLDVSKYKGISFTFKGTSVGPSGMLGFTVGRVSNDSKSENAMCGACTAQGDASTEESCHGPRVFPMLPASGATVTKSYLWSDFTGGKPQDSADPQHLTGILWYFEPPPAGDGGTSSADAGPDGGGPSYNVDITLDSIQFITATASDGGGTN